MNILYKYLIPFALKGDSSMAKISLICEQCGGHIILDDSHEIGTCEYCYAQFVIKKDDKKPNINNVKDIFSISIPTTIGRLISSIGI